MISLFATQRVIIFFFGWRTSICGSAALAGFVFGDFNLISHTLWGHDSALESSQMLKIYIHAGFGYTIRTYKFRLNGHQSVPASKLILKSRSRDEMGNFSSSAAYFVSKFANSERSLFLTYLVLLFFSHTYEYKYVQVLFVLYY